MKAVRFHEYGSSDVLVYEDVPIPVPGAGQVLVKVAATSFNPADAKLRAGYLSEVLPLDLPHVPGLDVAGRVAGVGEGVTAWAEGDAVVAFLPPTDPGAAAEYVLAPAEVLAAVPEGVDLIQVAALPAPVLTAWQAVFEHGGLRSGQRILVNGAGGAVGGYAVQLAHRAGAKVTATASPRSTERVRGNGADEIVDYTATPVTEALDGGFDVVFNLAPTSPEETAALAGLTADGGVFISATTPPPAETGRGVKTVAMGTRSDAAQLTELLGRVKSGDLRIDIAERKPLAELPAVHARADQGTLPGKTVIVI